MPDTLQELIDTLARLPSIGEKTAMKLAFFLVTKKSWLLPDISQKMLQVAHHIIPCPTCGWLMDRNDQQCKYCQDPKRDQHTICVIEEYADLLAIEQTWAYKWLYHVLGWSLSPLHGRTPKDLTFRELFTRIESIEEVIIATNPNFEWEATALYLRENLPHQVKLSRLSRWLPNAGYIDYVDHLTLMNALKWRQEYR